MSLSLSFRRLMAGAAASMALAAAAPMAPAQAQAQSQAPQTKAPATDERGFALKLNPLCVAFNDTKRRKNPYDEPLGLLADKVIAYSGWSEIQAGMKKNDFHFEGLCPTKSGTQPIVPSPAFRGFMVRIGDDESGTLPPPALLTQAVKTGAADPIAEQVVILSSMLAITNEHEMDGSSQDIETLALIRSLALAYTQANSMIFAVENAVKTDAHKSLNNFYDNVSEHVADLSDLHATALIAQKQGRNLSEAERQKFRDKVVNHKLQSPALRTQIAQSIASETTAQYMEKAQSDLNAGKNFTAPQRQSYNEAQLKNRLNSLPGNIGKSAAAQNYVQFWQQQRVQNKDPMIFHDNHIQELVKQIHAKMSEIRKPAAPQNSPAP